MAILETELKWRKKTSFISRDKHYTRYVLVCGLIMFQKSEGTSLVYSRGDEVISYNEFPEIHDELETEYKNQVKNEPLSKQDVRFVR